jgi:anti-sigma factor RsiW
MSASHFRKRLDHRWTQRRMSDFIDEDMTSRQRARFEAHASICPECGPLLRRLLKMVHALRGLRAEAGRSVAPSVIEHLRAER